MPDCEHLTGCVFFAEDSMKGMPKVAQLFRKKYCRGDNSECARYMVFKAGIKIPSNLFPNDIRRAKELISKRKK
jgi:hypothetical protein